MAFYLIDYENVNADGMQGVERLAETDRVMIFYSEHADRLTFELHRKLNDSAAQVEYIKVGTNKKHALDFQLVSFLGFLLAKYEDEQFYIISRDNGFRNVISFWAEKDITIVQLASIQQSMAEEETEIEEELVYDEEDDGLQYQVMAAMGETEHAADIAECIRNSENRQELHNALAARFRTDNVGEIYKMVKHLL